MSKTRTKLVEHATECLQAKGYFGAGIREILEGAEVPKGSLYHHFPMGKDDLVIEAIEAEILQLREWLNFEQKEGDISQIAKLISYFDHRKEHSVFLWLLIGLESSAQKGKVYEACHEAFLQFRSMLTDLLPKQGSKDQNVDKVLAILLGTLSLLRISKDVKYKDQLINGLNIFT
ncbi:MAG: TetR/AcrR family transcriptional regulator [Saprospiraceae bacterium]|nr:TetR/AcrR family transcriptional regulator [Saprospiraceae bacterium]